MSALKNLLVVIAVATGKRDQAAKNLFQVQRNLTFSQGQMNQLETYARETETRWMVAGQASTTPELMRHHYQFMARLQHAIGLQQGVLDQAARHLALEEKLLLDAEIRLSGLKTALEKKRASLALVQHRREQKQTDEFAASRRHYANLAF